jgi:transcriptional/translational regulatory protein YebC/TACO1
LDVISSDDGVIEVITSAQDFEAVKAALVSKGFEPEVAEVTLRAENSVSLGADDQLKMQKILDALEDLDDVQEVYHNAEM